MGSSVQLSFGQVSLIFSSCIWVFVVFVNVFELPRTILKTRPKKNKVQSQGKAEVDAISGSLKH